MTTFDGLGLRNRRAIPLAALPRETVTRFREMVLQADPGRVAAGRPLRLSGPLPGRPS